MSGKYQKVIDILKTVRSLDELKNHIWMIEEVFEVIKEMKGFNQETSYHPYNLYDHSLLTVINLPRNNDDDMLYIAALFHDIGKIYTKNLVNGKINYHGHEKESLKIVNEKVIPALENAGVVFSKDDKKRLEFYILKHDEVVGWPIDILKFAKDIKFKVFSNLMFLQVADSKSHKMTKVSLRKRIICYTYATFNGVFFYFIFNIYLYFTNLRKPLISRLLQSLFCKKTNY